MYHASNNANKNPDIELKKKCNLIDLRKNIYCFSYLVVKLEYYIIKIKLS